MTLGPQSKVKLSLADYVKISTFLIAWSVAGYAYVASGFAGQAKDQALNVAKFEAIREWQIDSRDDRLRMLQSLNEIKSALSRIEGRMEKP